MTQSFKQQNTDDVALILARRQVGLRHGLSNPMDKMAFDLSSSLSGVGDWWKRQDPAAQKAMMGAGIGGTLGLGSGLFRRGKKHPFRDLLTGAVAGGTLGGGIGLLGGHKALAEKAFPSSADEPDLANKITKLQDLGEKAQPSLLHQTADTMADHPLLSILGISGAADVGTGSALAAQGKNISPGAWRNVAKQLQEQIIEAGAKHTPYDTPIGQKLPKTVIDKLLSGDTEQLKSLSKDKNATRYMQSMRDVKGTYRPMTASQYVMQQAGLPKPTARARGRSLTMPDWLAKGVTQGKYNPLRKLPRSLPNIPKGKAALVGVPAALISAWLASKSALNVNSARDQITEMQKQLQQGAQ